ncbi:hypothetical protein Tco_0001007 [Tanacetum coccineum]
MRKVQSFVPMRSELEAQRLKRAGQEVLEEPVKRQKIREASGSGEESAEKEKELSEDKLQKLLVIVLVEEVYVEALQIFAEMLKKFDKDDLVKLWDLVKERFSTTEPTNDKEKELWVELKRLFEPDNDDTLWKLQRDLVLRRKKEKSLDYKNSFLGEYECSSLALDRGMRKKILDHLKQDQIIWEQCSIYRQEILTVTGGGLDENANPSCSTSNREFLDPKKKKEIESWLEDSRIVESLDRNTSLVYDQEKGTVTFEKDDEKITFKMPHKMEAFNRIDFKYINTDSIPPFVLGSNNDRGKTYYSDSLTLGPKYREDESISKESRHILKLEREAKRHKGEVM